MEISSTNKCYLPDEVWVNIFSYLSHNALQNVKLTCRNWYKLTHTANLLNKTKLNINRRNWSDLNKVIENDPEEFSKVNQYKNVTIDSINLDTTKLMKLQHLRANLQDLQMKNCRLLGIWEGNLFPNLHSLNIDGDSLQYEQSLCFQLCHLQRLYLIISNEFSAHHGFILLRNVSQRLSELDIRIFVDFAEITFLEDTIRTIKNLETLKIACFGKCSYDNLKAILQSLSTENNRLKHLSLRGNGIRDDLLEIFLEKWFNTLEVIDIYDCQELTDNGIKQLKYVKSTLNRLNLSNCYELKGEGLLEGIAETTNTVLRTLILSWAHKFHENIFDLLTERLPNLTKLSLVHCNKLVTKNCLQMISKSLKKLEILNLNGSLNTKANLSYNSIVSISYLKCPTLRILYLYDINAYLTKNNIEEFVRNCAALEELYIKFCPALSDECVYYIARKLKQLRILEIRLCLNLTERSIKYICRYCKKLQKFEFSDINSSWNSQEIKHKLLKYIPNLEFNFI